MHWTMASCVAGLAFLMTSGVMADERTDKPDGAIRAFAEAIDSQDFEEAFALLTPEAQKGFWTTVSQGSIGKVFPDAGMLEIGVDWPLDEEEAFVAYMEAAAAADALPFSMPDLGLVSATVDQPDVAIHLVETGGAPEIVVIQTNRTKKGWRVNKISWSHTDGRTLPWAMR